MEEATARIRIFTDVVNTMATPEGMQVLLRVAFNSTAGSLVQETEANTRDNNDQ